MSLTPFRGQNTKYLCDKDLPLRVGGKLRPKWASAMGFTRSG